MTAGSDAAPWESMPLVYMEQFERSPLGGTVSVFIMYTRMTEFGESLNLGGFYCDLIMMMLPFILELFCSYL